ncbi:sulfur carrier protein ThiS [Thalassomonas sp. RHCl1]|uniref:sulfur carrier protein ThiS n=1 Tax=Thalassomonas sp. RHCl1 TaxID=2995320 RepID=UPI00248AD50A|nr:sulfur carrier protein ThiS [Thalassomonas sp. RHCl1]
MMKITINGQLFELEQDHSVTAALALFLTPQQQKTSFAVALNGEFLARENYPVTTLSHQDGLDVLFPIQGG